MWITVDFDSGEAIYIQLYNQIIEAIAASRLREGESLPSVRQLANHVGVNMHTVNKAYAILKQDGYITLDRRRGAVIALDLNKIEAVDMMAKDLRTIIARAKCNHISTEEIHEIVDEVINEFDDIE
jgi:DNA-binding transcriptional regulator YhcF (GntR family)